MTKQDRITKIAMEFIDKIVDENLDDDEIYTIISKILVLFLSATKRMEGEGAAKIRMLNVVKMCDFFEGLADEVVNKTKIDETNS